MPTNIFARLLEWAKTTEANLPSELRTVQVRWLKINPDMAAYLLAEHNHKNRKIKDAVLKRIERSLRKGLFVPNGETIIVDVEGEIINGQTRLKACVNTGVSFISLVVWGVPTRAWLTVDQVSTRQAGDMLTQLEFAEPKVTAVAAKWFQAFIEDAVGIGRRSGGLEASPDRVVEIAKEHRGLEASSVFIASRKRLKRLIGAGPAAALHYLCRAVDAAKADSWFLQLDSQDNLQANSGIWHAVDKLTENRLRSRERSKLSVTPACLASIVIRCWNADQAGESMKECRLDPRYLLPVPRIANCPLYLCDGL